MEESAMTIRDMLVTVEETTSTSMRIGLAAWLAGKLGAHLTGLHAAPASPADFLPVSIDSGVDPTTFDMAEFAAARKTAAIQASACVQAARGTFERILAKQGGLCGWQTAADWSGAGVATHARYVDLAVVGQLAPDADRARAPDPGDVALGSGGPVLVVPHWGRHETIERHALIGWNASREARRAIQDALPLLKLVRSVTVLTIGPDHGAARYGEEAGADIARHLARHGLQVDVEQMVADWDHEPADLLLARAAELGSDLIVMGAYGHSRLREMVFGGATRSVLKYMPVPVLMSH
jgi:nucleotide-binding universal stress UspA family protein